MALVREVVIKNRCGFHVRPIQRFTQLAKAFKSDITVTIGGRSAPGKSIVHLMTLKGECGSKMKMAIAGADEKQAMCVLSYLAESLFFVEDELDKAEHPTRHMERLVRFSESFDSDIKVTYGRKSCSAKDHEAVLGLGFQPWEKPGFEIAGSDVAQAESVLDTLTKYNFFVEEDFEDKKAPLADRQT